jgi:hypothetical protein
MLSFEIRTDGGVTIEGTERDLRELSGWLDVAASIDDVSVSATFIADEGKTTIDINRLDDPDVADAAKGVKTSKRRQPNPLKDPKAKS